jgi:hypothetical protein
VDENRLQLYHGAHRSKAANPRACALLDGQFSVEAVVAKRGSDGMYVRLTKEEVKTALQADANLRGYESVVAGEWEDLGLL